MLSIEDANIDASLFFLDVALTKLNINVGAALFVDFDKSSALRKEDVPGPNFGRVTQGDFSKITQISDLFVIGAIAGATLEVEDAEVSLDVADAINPYIPKLNFGIAAHFRKELDIKSSNSTRRLLHDGNRRSLGRLHEGSDHRALPLFRSLRGLETDADDSVADENFTFDGCEITNGTCVVLTDVTLDVATITDFVSPIVAEFVNADKTGVLDQIVDPLEPLREPIPGLSEITGKTLSVLDVAECFDRLGSGVSTVRKMFEIYDGLSTLAASLENLDGIVLAEKCDVLANFNCSGGLADALKVPDDDPIIVRRLVDATYYDPFGSLVDGFGLPMTPRILMTCEQTFATETCKNQTATEACGGCTGKVKPVKCKARLLKCKADSVDGLSFPILSDPLGALGLLSGGDVVSCSRFQYDCDDLVCSGSIIDSSPSRVSIATTGLFAARDCIFLQLRTGCHLISFTRMHIDRRL